MGPHEVSALAATGVIALLVILQGCLALGLPLGRAAWGGRHRVLPSRLRWASAAAIPILGLAAWTILARASLVAPGPEVTTVRVSTWFFAGYFGLNTVANIASRSALERDAMTPTAAVLFVCFVVVALS